MLMRLAALASVVPLAASIERPLDAGHAEITALDVGEGTSVVVRTAHHVLVYGTGDSYGTDGRMADSVVVPFLRSSGIRAIDRLVIPRASPAGGAGVAALLAAMPVRETIVGGDAVDSESAACASVSSPWQWDGITFALREAAAGHACVLSVSSAAGEVRFPGDAVAALEGPTWVVVSGRRASRAIAKYARLHPEVQGAEVLATGERGAIRVLLDAEKGLGAPEAYRETRRTLWSGAP
jgi:competence protein ComEC